MLIYAVYYVAAAMTHIQNGMIAPGYDWYRFFFAGARSVVIVLPIVIALLLMESVSSYGNGTLLAVSEPVFHGWISERGK